jgi:hypothetical protein
MLGLGRYLTSPFAHRCHRLGIRAQSHLAAAVTIAALLAVFTPQPAYTMPVDLTLDQMKAKLASTNTGDKPHLCVQIAQRQMTETSKLYAATEDEKAQAAMTDVVAFSELARDYAIESHKYQKQTEIAVREMTRKLIEIMHSLGHDDQAPVRDAVTRMQRVRDDLLMAMFPKGQR